MAPRPYCLQCGSSNVIFDEDVLNSNRSVYCYICGNRQYQGMDYVGFEMREEPMAARGTCKNCKRPNMCIASHGYCAPCAKTSKAFPEPSPERDAAMAAAAEKIKEMSGPRPYKKRIGAASHKDQLPRPDRKERPAIKDPEKGFTSADYDGHSAAPGMSGRRYASPPILAENGAPSYSDPSSGTCAKSRNPYTYCPLVFVHEDFMVGRYVTLLVSEVRRIAGLPIAGGGHEEAQKIDRCISEITAYMNGRMTEVKKSLKGE